MASTPLNFLRAFDWVLHSKYIGLGATSQPTSIFLEPRWHLFTRLLSHLSQLGNNSVDILAVGGADRTLSKVKGLMMKFIRSEKFRHIFYEAMDIRLQPIRPLPTLLTDIYVVPQVHAMRAAYVQQIPKDRWLLAAWGAVNPQLDRSYHRAEAVAWSRRHENESWLHAKRLAPAAWWRELPRYRFILSPDGTGVQTPKPFEGLLVGDHPHL